MKLMSDGLEAAAGSRLKGLLEKLTKNKFIGMLVGLGITAIIQSSSATTVMVVGFVNAGIMNLTQAVGVIMGANIGTTVTAQIVAFGPKSLAPAFIFIGATMVVFFKNKKVIHIGQIIAGLGILFLGMNEMGAAMKPLSELEGFKNVMVAFKDYPLLGILTGAIFTGVIQSSSASIAILQGIALSGAIGLDSAIFILFGQNIGTCVTALLASLGVNKTAKRVSIVHLLFNVFGTIIFVIIVSFLPFVKWIEALSPGSTVAQIALAHIIFNIVTTLIMLPCSNLLVKISKKLIKGKDKYADGLHFEFIDDTTFKNPSVATIQLIKEIGRMSDLAKFNIHTSIDAFINKDRSKMEDVYANEKVIDYLNHNITNYLVKATTLGLSPQDVKKVGSMFHVVSDLERIGDHAENIVEYTDIVMGKNVQFSSTAFDEIRELQNRVDTILNDAMFLFNSETIDQNIADRIWTLEDEMDLRTKELKDNHIERLSGQMCLPEASMLFLEILTDLERCADHATNIAFAMGGKGKQSR
jgi:phosphate:Na+ symporter